MSYKMLVIDLDDTLLNNNLEIGEENSTALRLLNDRGVKVILCSGRPIFSMEKYVKQLFPALESQYFIAFNGARVLNAATEEELFSKSLSREASDYLLDLARTNDIVAQIYKGIRFYAEKAGPETQAYAKASGMEFIQLTDTQEFKNYNTPKILFNAVHDGYPTASGQRQRIPL